MGTNLNGSRRQILEWAEAHIGAWGTNQAGIGLTSAQVIDLGVSVANARQAFTTVEQTRDIAKSETQVFYSLADDVHQQASVAVAAIKAFARNTDDPSAVYLLAQITGTNPASPVAPPTQPTIVSAVLNPTGTITINFAGTGPMGTVWQVSRKLFGETGYTIIGNANATSKSYTDTTVPIGTDSAMYSVQGVRSSISGTASLPVTVQFGSVASPAQSEAA